MKLSLKVLLAFALASGVARADTSLIEAIESGNQDEAIRLIEGGADVNAKDEYGRTPLHMAAGNNAVDVVNLLISKGADINAEVNRGKVQGNWEIWFNGGKVPLHYAASSSAVDAMALLIRKGASLSAKDQWGRMPLHLAAESDVVDGVAFLIGVGADINAQSGSGTTALNDAVFSDNFGVATWLIKKGANVNIADSDGDAPLHRLSVHVVNDRESVIDLVNLLIDNGADVNARDSNGVTFFEDVIRYDADSVKWLVSKGADVDAQDQYGNTLLCRAKLQGNSAMATALKSAGAVAERGEPYPVDDSASQTNLITSAVNAAAMVAIVDEDNIGETGAAAGQAIIDLSNAETARSKAKRAREKWERCEN